MQSGELLKKLLENRGVDEGQIDSFLLPDYEKTLHDPFLFKDMERACVRIFEAIDQNQKIVVYADYDADGIPGAVIFNDFFKRLGMRILIYTYPIVTMRVMVYIKAQ
ncbi:hypothetical protein IPJ63_01865 [Candidatus Nomurabacteria bacterium]|nr:MAG: hypothetical protein IPJ63_01865 [Candidatus Nomurabacteria bacterium]